jgi:hypothetical protein
MIEMMESLDLILKIDYEMNNHLEKEDKQPLVALQFVRLLLLLKVYKRK